MKRILTFVLALVFFTGCFHYEEEMILKKDGSGEVTVKFVFGKFISTMMSMDDDKDIEKNMHFKLRNEDGLKILDESVYERLGRRVYEVTVKFDHFKDLRHLDIVSPNYSDDDMDMDVRDFFDDIQFDGNTFSRRIDLDNKGNNNNGDDEVPRFVSKMVDVEFHFSLEIEGKESKEWAFDLDDIANKRELIMRVK